jgi:microcompartment protein CcmK/EutM
MLFAMVRGSVVASQKVKELEGVSLKLLIPCDENKNPVSEPIVAIDAIGARSGDLVMWAGKREASMAFPDAQVINNFPVDAAVTGIIDDIS